jgi:hypothetical protein
MARPIHKLTALTIKRTHRDGRHGDGGGLYLQVDGRSKSWLFRYKRRAAKLAIWDSDQSIW